MASSPVSALGFLDRRDASFLGVDVLATLPAAKVIESRAGRIVVRHDDGYVFVFQIHDLDGQIMNLEEVTWSPIGAPPDADELEQQARVLAEAEARRRGWLV